MKPGTQTIRGSVSSRQQAWLGNEGAQAHSPSHGQSFVCHPLVFRPQLNWCCLRRPELVPRIDGSPLFDPGAPHLPSEGSVTSGWGPISVRVRSLGPTSEGGQRCSWQNAIQGQKPLTPSQKQPRGAGRVRMSCQANQKEENPTKETVGNRTLKVGAGQRLQEEPPQMCSGPVPMSYSGLCPPWAILPLPSRLLLQTTRESTQHWALLVIWSDHRSHCTFQKWANQSKQSLISLHLVYTYCFVTIISQSLLLLGFENHEHFFQTITQRTTGTHSPIVTLMLLWLKDCK